MKVQSAAQLEGAHVVDGSGRRVGLIRRLICAPGDPYTVVWAVVSLGPWWARQRFVPMGGARYADRGIALSCQRDLVAAAPAPPRHACAERDVLLNAAAHYHVGRAATAG